MNYSRQMKGNTLVISDEQGKELLLISEIVGKEDVLFVVSGELRNELAYELEDELMAVLTVQHRVRIDLSGLEFIASAGLRTLLSVQQLVDNFPDGNLVICALSSSAAKVFEETGFTELFQIETKGAGI